MFEGTRIFANTTDQVARYNGPNAVILEFFGSNCDGLGLSANARKQCHDKMFIFSEEVRREELRILITTMPVPDPLAIYT